MRIEARRAADITGWRWPNFTPSEFASKDDGSVILESDFLDRLQDLRERYGRPMVLSSGYRTPAHNVKVSTTGPKGPHTTGRAVDVKVAGGKDRFLLVALAIECGFTGIGVAKSFIHLDDIIDHPSIPRPAVWSY